jgi:hypothetical protein
MNRIGWSLIVAVGIAAAVTSFTQAPVVADVLASPRATAAPALSARQGAPASPALQGAPTNDLPNPYTTIEGWAKMPPAGRGARRAR